MKYRQFYTISRPSRAIYLALGITMGSTPSFAESNFEVGTVIPAGKNSITITKSSKNKLMLGLNNISISFQQYLLAVEKGTEKTGSFSSKNPAIKGAEQKVVIDAVAKNNIKELELELKSLGAEITGISGSTISAIVPLSQLSTLESMEALKFARPAFAFTRTGSITSQGDEAQFSDIARTTFSTDGTGVTVGVLSDSFDCSGDGSYATDILSGDLPSGINILDDTSSSCSDEGRAMAQIVFDVAPGANQSFHTAFTGEAAFAQGILDLAAAGADIIVDDVGYFAAPMFQDGIVAQAVNTVTANGVSYFSSAGNNDRQSYQAEFNDSGILGPFGGTLHDFDSGPGVDNRLTIQQNSNTTYSFQWENPFFSVSGAPGATTDLDICFYSPIGNSSPFLCFNDANLLADPLEIGRINGLGSLEISIERFSGANPGTIKLVAFGDIAFPENHLGINASTIYGHNNAANANAVGASAYFLTPFFGEISPVLNYYSSAGSTPIRFDTSGNPINDIRQKPEFSAPDGGNNTFFGSDFESDGFPNFFGTSAAAPHAAGVAALMLDINPSLTPTQITNALKSTAIDIIQRETLNFGGPRVGIDTGFDNDSGEGLINADAAIASILPPEADLTLTMTDSADPIMAGSTLSYTLTVNNLGPADASSVQVSNILPAGVSFSSTSGCSNDPSGIPICNLGNLLAGQSTQFTLIVDINQATLGTITGTATVSSATADPLLANNQTSEDTVIMAYGDINLDGCIGRDDVRALLHGLRASSMESTWDFNSDSTINRADARALVQLYTFANGACP